MTLLIGIIFWRNDIMLLIKLLLLVLFQTNTTQQKPGGFPNQNELKSAPFPGKPSIVKRTISKVKNTTCNVVTFGQACTGDTPYQKGIVREVINKKPLSATATAAAASTSTCTLTKVSNGTCPTCIDLILGPTCTAADLFKYGNPNCGVSSPVTDPACQLTDFHLADNSMAIGVGADLSSIPGLNRDIEGNPRPTPGRDPGKGWDIGAYQYTGNTPTPTLKAQFLGTTGEDFTGGAVDKPDGIPDWHLTLNGLRSIPVAQQLFTSASDGLGFWEAPSNGMNYIIHPIYNGTAG